MAVILGYLRRYARWNGEPGLTLDEQKAEVHRIASKIGGRRNEVDCPEDRAEGIDNKWPLLESLLWEVGKNGPHECRVILIVPTLDGVRLNLQFLGALADDENYLAPICVSGLSQDEVLANRRRYFPGRNFWQFSKDGHWLAFDEMVQQVRDRQQGLSRKIRSGIRAARDRGVPMGAKRPGAHRFTAAEKKKGGSTSAAKRRKAANEPYKHLIPELLRLRETIDGKRMSLHDVTIYLAGRGVKTPEGDGISPMRIHRIVERAENAAK